MSNGHRFVVMFTIDPDLHGGIDNLIKYRLHYFMLSCCIQNHLTNPLDKPLVGTPSPESVDNLWITWG